MCALPQARPRYDVTASSQTRWGAIAQGAARSPQVHVHEKFQEKVAQEDEEERNVNVYS